MTTYRIITPEVSFQILVSGNEIMHAPPYTNLKGTNFPAFRNLAAQYAWPIIPVLDKEPPRLIEHRGDIYEFHWEGNTLTRITLYPNDAEPTDLLYAQLPTAIQRLL